MALTVNLRSIIPNQEEFDSMGRRRYQKPNVHRTTAVRAQWYFRARVDMRTATGIERKERTYYLGYCDEMGKRKAEKDRDAILDEAINRPQLIIQSQVKFREVLKAFEQDHLPTLRAITRRGYTSVIEHWLQPQFGDKRLCDIDARLVQQWINTMPTISTKTRAGIVTMFRIVWNKALAWNYTQMACPAKYVAMGPRRIRWPKLIPTRDQFRMMLAVLDPIHRDMAELAVITGMRVSEIRGLPVRAVDLAERCARVEQRKDAMDILEAPKSERGRRVLPLGYMAQRLAPYLKGKAPDDLVFEAAPKYDRCQTLLCRAAKAAGFESPGFGYHTLRRMHNTWLRKGGLSVDDAKTQMGHTTAAVNDLYLVAEAEDYRRREAAVLRLQAELMGEPKGGVM